MKNTKSLIEDYYKHHRLIKSSRTEEERKEAIEESPFFEAVEYIWKLIYEDKFKGWNILLELINNAPNEYILACIGSGELENYLVARGKHCIEKVEKEALKNPKFRKSLSSVWKRDMDKSIWTRIRQAAELGVKSD